MQTKKHVTKNIDRDPLVVDTSCMNLGAAIKYRRLALGYTQKQLAEALGMDRQRVIQLENPSYLPSIRTLLRVAHGLGVSASSLVRDAERMAKK